MDALFRAATVERWVQLVLYWLIALVVLTMIDASVDDTAPRARYVRLLVWVGNLVVFAWVWLTIWTSAFQLPLPWEWTLKAR